MATNRLIAVSAAGAAAAMVACGGGGDSAVRTALGCVEGTERLEVVSGGGQTGAPGAVLAQRPTVRLSCASFDDRGSTMMVAGANIQWRGQTELGNLVDGKPQVTRRSAADGTSSVVWTLGRDYLRTMWIEARYQLPGMEALAAQFNASTSGTTTTALRCEDPGGTDHGAALTLASATLWSAAGSPHRGGTVTLANSATLSIEAGAVVCVETISVASSSWGMVSAMGTARAPIRFIGTALRASGELAHVIGDNMPAVGTADHPVSSLQDSSFGWSKARDPALCAQVVVGGDFPTLNRVSIRRCGSAGCAALAVKQPPNPWDYGPASVSARVLDSVGDGVVVVAPTPFHGGNSVEFGGCEVSSSGGHGIVIASHPVKASGCNLFGNDGNAIVNRSAVSVSAIGNWWGDPAGPMGPSGDGVSGNVDFSNPASAPASLAY